MTRKSVVLETLNNLGYKYNQKAQRIIKDCDDWYCNKETEFHKRRNINNVSITIPSINFAKRICSDDANLCEIVEVNPGEASFEPINDILKANRFDVQYRKQLEKLSASGTVGAYIRLDNADVMNDGTIKNGTIAINYCDAENIIPLTVVNDDVIECAFVGEDLKRTDKTTTMVVFTQDEEGRYIADSYYFTEEHEIVEMRTSIQLDIVKPFAIMRVAEVNNMDDMEGYGLPKLYTSIPTLKALDLANYILFGDLDKGDKIVFINELLSCVGTTTDGTKFLTPQQKELFVLLGEKLPTQDSIVQEYNPLIRVDEITKIFELLLSLLSMSFGYGTKKYTFENGKITTATEYIGERQDAMQDLNKQRKESIDYITGIAKAIKWFSNEFNGTAFNLDEEICIDFDDSYIVDRETELERLRNDALTFDIPIIKVWYMMKAYNLDEAEATKLVMADIENKDAEDKEDANFGNDD